MVLLLQLSLCWVCQMGLSDGYVTSPYYSRVSDQIETWPYYSQQSDVAQTDQGRLYQGAGTHLTQQGQHLTSGSEWWTGPPGPGYEDYYDRQDGSGDGDDNDDGDGQDLLNNTTLVVTVIAVGLILVVVGIGAFQLSDGLRKMI